MGDTTTEDEAWRRTWEQVAAVVDRADIEGLLEAGAPADEYSPEINDFTALVVRGEVDDDAVRAVWAQWFSPDTALQHDAELVGLAADLRALRA